MIKQLNVKHIALIDDITLTFNEGLTALTGETGAGKSIIMESLQLLFGKRSDKDLIRHGFDEAVVSGLFEISKSVQEAFDLPATILITRTMTRAGKHTMKINDQVTTLQKIKQITTAIGDIHEQDDMYALLDPQSYTAMIDSRQQSITDPLKMDYLLAKNMYEEAIQKLKVLEEDKVSFEKQKDLLLFQLNELQTMDLKHNELLEIQEELETLKHFDKLSQALKRSVGLFQEEHILEHLYDIKTDITFISEVMQSKKELSERMEDAYYNIEDLTSELESMLEHLDYNESHFQSLNEREFALLQLEKKYQKSIAELIIYQEELEQKAQMNADYQTFIDQQNAHIEHLKKATVNAAKKLHDARIKIASDMQKEMIDVLKTVDLEQTSFTIDIQMSDTFYEDGMDLISFNISLNEGEPLKPLHKVASGGERARFMFALKTTAAKHHHVSMLILDEIDTGVSGKTAAKVATHMESIASHMQLIVITHLPQVAAKATHHILVSKHKNNDRMITTIQYLNHQERIKAIAYMLSDEHISAAAVEQAKWMLTNEKKRQA